jgi:uncharacterized membrane protein HdeD (DUF308 family)
VTTTRLEGGPARDAARFWWLYLVAAGGWFLFAVIVFRFDWETVSSISILFGIVMLAAAVMELVGVFAAVGWWRVAHGALAAAFAVIGVIAFVHPGDTFAALAAVLSFYFIFKGTFDLVVAIAGHGELDLWWLRLAIGVAELLLGFWAAGYFGRSVVLLVVWIGATALTRGITDVLQAFALRRALRA